MILKFRKKIKTFEPKKGRKMSELKIRSHKLINIHECKHKITPLDHIQTYEHNKC